MRFAVMTLLVFVAGGWARKFRASLPACFAAGLVVLALEMLVFSVLGLRWTVLGLLVLPLFGSAVARPPLSFDPKRWLSHRTPIALAALAIFTITILSATATSGDFVFFWGTKAQHFAQERMLDVEFLRNPEHAVMHPEYPPLVPLYYAWTMLGASELDWFAAMASAILFLALATWETRSPLFAAMFALLFIRNDIAGNAEPALIFFEVVALSALGVVRASGAPPPEGAPEARTTPDVIAAIALCGVALTKIEGAVFVVLVIVFLARRWKVALPPLLVLAGWWIFAKSNGLLGTQDPRYAFSFAYVWPSLKQLVGQMSFGLWYLPWIAIAVMWASPSSALRAPSPRTRGEGLSTETSRERPSPRLRGEGGRRPGEGLLHLAATLAFLAFMVLSYARPEAHMEWSAQRVLMTPLVLFFFSAITRSA